MFRVVNTIRLLANSQVRLAVGSLSNLRVQTRNNAPNLFRSVIGRDVSIAINCRIWNESTTAHHILGRRHFQTTPCRKAAPVLLLFIKPIAKATAVIFGRTVKRWWKALPPEKREAIVLGLQRHKRKIYASLTLIPAGFILYYVTHLEVDPITGRTKFIIFNNEQVLDVAQTELDMQIELYQDKFLPPSHPIFIKVTNVCNRLLKSNNDMPQVQQRKWLVTVVDEPKIRNAFVLPTGHIFIFTGLVNLCSNDDQLCAVISHEISHVLLNHPAEQMSNLGFVQMILMVPLAFIWAVLPDAAALLTQWLWDYLAKLTFHLPFARSLEAEADKIGLFLTAKACYDVRESSVLWAKMAMYEDETVVEILSTHPSSETRQETLDKLMPGAIKLREDYKCPRLPAIDPRSFIPRRHPAIDPRTDPTIGG